MAGVSHLYTINLNTGTATIVGAVGGGAPTIDGIAVDPACNYLIRPASLNVPASGGQNTLNVSANGSGCGWTAVSNNNWITINSGASGNGNGTVTFTVAANPGPQRTGTMTVAGKTFTVTQAATAGCPGNAVANFSGQVNIPDNTPAGVNITLNVNVAGNPMIGDLNFRFDTAGACDATVGNANAAVTHTFVGDLIFKLTSPGGTTVTLMNRRGGTRENICLTTLNDDGGYPSVSTITSVTGQPLAGDYAPDNPLSAFNGQAMNGAWVLNVSDNSANDTGQVWRFSLLFNQECQPQNCNNQVTPNSFNISGAGSSNNMINVTSPCLWTAVSNDNWISLQTGANSQGNGTVTFQVDTNFTNTSRAGSLTVAGKTVNVTQDAACVVGLPASNATHPVAGGNFSLVVTAGMGCPWMVLSSPSWLSITSGASGTGIGTVNYSVQPNLGNSPRTGTITISGNNTFQVTQAAAATCNGNPPVVVSYTGPDVAIPDNVPAGVNFPIQVSGVGTITDLNFRFDTAGACDATIGNPNAAVDHLFVGDLIFKLTSPAGTTVTFLSRRGGTRENICLMTLNDDGGLPNVSTISAVTGSPMAGDFAPEPTGQLQIFDGQNANGTWILNVSDNAGIDQGNLRRFSLVFNSCDGCNYQLSQPGFNAPAAGAQSTVDVTCGANCAWAAQSNANWLAINNGASGNGNGTVSFTAAANAGAQRTGTLTIAGQTFTVTQAANCGLIIINPALLSNATVGAQYTQLFNAQGGVAPYGFNLAQGSTLPPGLSIINGVLTGAPQQAGTFNFTIQALDLNGCTGTKPYALVVNPPCGTLSATPSNMSDATQGTAYNQSLLGNGGTAPYSFASPNFAIPGLTLNANGTITSTPTTPGQYNFTANINDANGCTGSSQISLRVNAACNTITITPPGLPNGTTGTAYNQQLNQSGGNGNIGYAVTAGALPNGLNLSASGLISGTPTQTGTFNFTVTATDANGCTGQKSYQVAVSCPTITVNPATLPNGTTGTAYNQQLTQTGGVGNTTFGVTVGSLPAGLNLSLNGLLSGTPTQTGQVNFTVTAADANGCLGTRQYTLPLNAGCPTINVGPNPPSPAFVGVPYQHTFNATGGTAPYTYSLVAGSQLLDGLMLSTAGVLSGTPTGIGGNGSAFTVKATDANGCTGQVQFGLSLSNCPTITVNPSNATLPVGQAGMQYNQTFTQTGGVGAATFTITAGALPNGLSLATGGALTGTPTAFGNFNFTVKATDANGCLGTRAYSLTINPPCATVTVNPTTLPNGTVGTAYNQTATATGGTAPYAYSISAGALPGGLTLASGGGLTGTPSVAGVFNFTIKATDANGCMGTRAYTLTISGPTSSGLQFYPLSKPLRLLDTRAGQLGCDAPGSQIPGNTSRTQLARRTCDGITIPANALAATGNITTVQSGGGYLTLYPSDAQQPLVANSNYAANEIINNVFTVGLGNADGSFKIFVTSNTDVVVDITGYYAPPPMSGAGGLYFHPLPKPIRLLETRAGFSGAFTPGAKLPANADTPQQARVTYDGVTIPSTALAIVGNATTLNGGAGYITLYPGGVARPLAASSNFNAGQVMNAPFTVGLSATGEFNIFTTTSLDMVVDVLGYYSTDATDANGAGLLFNPLAAPVRLLETRAGFTGCFVPGAPLSAGSTRNQQARGACGGQTIANNALAIVGNATVVNNQAGYLTFWPNGAAQPLVASSNFAAGQVLNRHFTVGLGATGMFNIFASAQTDLIVDVSGFFAP